MRQFGRRRIDAHGGYFRSRSRRFAGDFLDPIDIAPGNVLHAQAVGSPMPAHRRSGKRVRRLVEAGPDEALRDFRFGALEILAAIEAQEAGDLRIARLPEQPRFPSNRRGGIGDGGDGVTAVLLTIAERAHAVFPGLAPDDAGQPDDDPAARRRRRNSPFPAQLQHVIPAEVVIDPRGDSRNADGRNIAFGRMQVSTGRIAAQRPGSAAVGFPRRQPERELQ
ncbi:MAG: hypothetical protein A3I00_02210 [Betaproteobacteria bacterium RIFCSPLOWO2_02_FULL_64_12]|nr:MAG: hypothetical protein A3I00_02210 [Betaproteobacteria bacterium RIFCSPLOWO2_02_FULL_64_12]